MEFDLRAKLGKNVQTIFFRERKSLISAFFITIFSALYHKNNCVYSLPPLYSRGLNPGRKIINLPYINVMRKINLCFFPGLFFLFDNIIFH